MIMSQVSHETVRDSANDISKALRLIAAAIEHLAQVKEEELKILNQEMERKPYPLLPH